MARVRSLSSQVLCEVGIDHGTTVLAVIQEVERQLGIPAGEQRLAFGGRKLWDRELLSPLFGVGLSGAEDGDTVVELVLVRVDTAWAQMLDELRKGRASLGQGSHPDLQANAEAVLAAVEYDDWAVKYAAESLRSNADFMLEVVRRNPVALKHAAEQLRASKAFMLSVVEHDYRALGSASAPLRADSDVVLAAISKNIEAVKYANVGDKRLMLSVVAQHGRALRFASKNLRADFAVVRAAVTQDGGALQYAAGSRQGDREVVLAAVGQDGRALQLAAVHLRADPGVVLKAVSQNGSALMHAAPCLQADRTLVLAAIAQDCRALRYAANQLRSDADFMLEATKRHQRRAACERGLPQNAIIAAGFLACVERHRVADLQAGETNADMLYDQRIVTRVAVGCLGFHGYSHHQHDVMSGRGDVRTLRYASKTLLEDKQFMAAASP
eukprot:CAMPEP_0117555480 /NCGR_PEP_ID=MMETSP0784-20121206/51296_1 /TAXON_ID=39447 /ORGANISM="" /LENGTH=440 /DNA_ID=CAMNT_0005352687 /DNA_START=97 /DNA_END=1420 /DNA_ORIENTATION=-